MQTTSTSVDAEGAADARPLRRALVPDAAAEVFEALISLRFCCLYIAGTPGEEALLDAIARLGRLAGQ